MGCFREVKVLPLIDALHTVFEMTGVLARDDAIKGRILEGGGECWPMFDSLGSGSQIVAQVFRMPHKHLGRLTQGQQ